MLAAWKKVPVVLNDGPTRKMSRPPRATEVEKSWPRHCTKPYRLLWRNAYVRSYVCYCDIRITGTGAVWYLLRPRYCVCNPKDFSFLLVIVILHEAKQKNVCGLVLQCCIKKKTTIISIGGWKQVYLTILANIILHRVNYLADGPYCKF